MKVTKTQALMLILKTLLESKELHKEDITNIIDIDDTKFHRYMQEVRAFFDNFHLPYCLRYSKSLSKYVLESK